MNSFKFRAWDSRNEEYVYSDKDDCFYLNTKGVLFMYAIPKLESELGGSVYHKSYDVDMFSGKVCNDGQDIYAGDIMIMNYAPLASCKGYISYEDGCFWFNTEEATPEKCSLYELSQMNNPMTVIGTIRENPEILTKG